MNKSVPCMPALLSGLVLVAGCGGITRAPVIDGQTDDTGGFVSGDEITVMIGRIVSRAKIGSGMTTAVCRYLRDQTAVALSLNATFTIIDPNDTTAELVAQFKTERDRVRAVKTASMATADVEVLEIREKLGATVKVGFVSKQKKYARAKLKLTVTLKNGTKYSSVCTGKSSKGAWGVVAMVDRNKMKKGTGIWNLDESMVGQACVDALRSCVRAVARQANADARGWQTGVEERFLRPRSVPFRVTRRTNKY